MNNKNLLLLFLLTLFFSCQQQPNPLENKKWFGTIIRNSDNRELGKTSLFFQNDSLTIYSNAIFDRTRNSFVLLPSPDKEKTIFVNTGVDSLFKLNVKYQNDSLIVNGSDFKIHATVDSGLFLNFKNKEFKNEIVPKNAQSYIYGFWKGSLFRSTDQKELSKIVLVSSYDSVKVFSNAVFGKDNKYSLLNRYDPETESYIYVSPYFDWLLFPKDGDIAIIGNDFYAYLKQVDDLDTSFFKNKKVPVNTSLYLVDNVYQGKIIPKGRYAAASTMIEYFAEVKILNEEYLQASHWTKSTNSPMGMFAAMGGLDQDYKNRKVEKLRYTMKDGYLIFGNDRYQILDNGNTLFLNRAEAMIKMKKGKAISTSQKAYERCWKCFGSGQSSRYNSRTKTNYLGICPVCNGKGKLLKYK